MDGIHVVVENPLPVISDVNSASRQCAGTVTLGVSSPGAVIDWYADAAATLTLLTGASYTTPEIRTSMTYYAQARIAETGCLSARIPVLAEVITEGCCHAPGVTNIIFAEFNPCSGAPYASTYTLTDDRDQKNYIIKYMPDGRYWMIQDLKFGNCTVSSGKSDDSETATKNAPTVYDGYVGHCAAATTTNSPSDISYFYSWAAAMNNSKAYKGSNESTFACSGTGSSTKNCQGICPKGWHIPTPDEYADANSKFTTFFNCSNFSCWGSGSEWSGTLPGCLTCSNASIWNASYTHYWTSGSSDANNAKCHISSTSGVWINSGCIKCDYMHVRCIRNYDNY
jgi:uncharacterized protein (TIGR02145 family)